MTPAPRLCHGSCSGGPAHVCIARHQYALHRQPQHAASYEQEAEVDCEEDSYENHYPARLREGLQACACANRGEEKQDQGSAESLRACKANNTCVTLRKTAHGGPAFVIDGQVCGQLRSI